MSYQTQSPAELLAAINKKPSFGNTKKTLTKEQRLAKQGKPKLPVQNYRLLPVPGTEEDPTGPRFFEEVYFHELSINGKGDTYACTQLNEGKPCPICEEKDRQLAAVRARVESGELVKGTPPYKEAYKAAFAFDARKNYILRLISREASGDGVKLWFIKQGSELKNDMFVKILKELDTNNLSTSVLTDVENGVDLKIRAEQEIDPRSNRPYWKPLTVDIGSPKPLAGSLVEINTILSENATLSWEDMVFKPEIEGLMTSYEFLRETLAGRRPEFIPKEGWRIIKADGSSYIYDRRAAQAAAGPAVETSDVTSGTVIGTPYPNGAPATPTNVAQVVTGGFDADDLPF